MQKVLRYAAEDLGFEEGKTIKLECTDQHGYFFRVTLKEEQALRKSKNYKIIDAIKGGVRFTNSKLTELNKDYETIKEEYVERQKTVVAEIFEVAGELLTQGVCKINTFLHWGIRGCENKQFPLSHLLSTVAWV